MANTNLPEGNLKRLASTHELEEKMDKNPSSPHAGGSPENPSSSDSEKTIRLEDVKEDVAATPKDPNTEEDDGQEEVGQFFGRKMRVAYGPGYGPGSISSDTLAALLGPMLLKPTMDQYAAGFAEHLQQSQSSSSASTAPGQGTPDADAKPQPDAKPTSKKSAKKGKRSRFHMAKRHWAIEKFRQILLKWQIDLT